MLTRWHGLAAALAATLAALAPASAQTIDITALSRRTGADREARLLEGARKEGEVDVYSTLVPEDIGAVAAAFEEKYGVKVKFLRASSGRGAQRSPADATH